jgi:predicted dehydrogenase
MIARLPAVVVVGAGAIAQVYGQLLRDNPAAVPMGVVDVDVAAAERLAGPLGCPAAASLDELVARGHQPDVVVVCTPPATHLSITEQAARHRCAVFTEKPVADTRASARRLVEIATGNEFPFAMATKFRFVPEVETTKAMIERGQLGDIRLVEAAFSSRLDQRGRWPSDRAVSGGGVIVDNGTHALDLAMHLLGSFSTIRAVEGYRPAGLDVEDSVSMFGRIGDAHVYCDLSWSIESHKPHYLRVVGSEGEVAVGFASSRWRTFGGEWTTFGSNYNKFVAMGGAFGAFVDWVAHNRRDPRLSDGLEVADVVDAALTSLVDGRSIAL